MSKEELTENIRIYGVPIFQPKEGGWVSTLKSVPCKEEFDAYVESIHSSKDDTPSPQKFRIVT